MSKLLPTLLVLVTRHPRYRVMVGRDFNWSSKSWTHNLFRVLELLFWRREGIRAEMSAIPWEGKTYYFCHSFESVIALCETYVREMLQAFSFQPIKLYRPALVGGPSTGLPYLFAIAFDSQNSNDGGIAVTNTFSITCTGSNLTLTSGAVVQQSPQPTATAKYNSVSMTAGSTNSSAPGGLTNVYVFYLANPSTGSNSLVVTASASARNYGGAISLSGTATSPAGAQNTNQGTSTTPSVVVATGSANSWVVDSVYINNTIAADSPSTTGTNQNSRYQVTHVVGGEGNIGSTETTTTAGNYTLSWTMLLSNDWASAALEIKANPSIPTLLSLGVGV